ncbi:hypothetical protein D3C81_2204940 [compost metagenome]
MATTITSGSKLMFSKRQIPKAHSALTTPASNGRLTPRQVRSNMNSIISVTAKAARTS